MEEVTFLFDNQLIAALESLIRGARNKLILISPYIGLGARIKDALNEKISKHNFELYVLFGKNDENYLKSIKKDSLDFLMQFPNIEIRYNERLHAKFYQNDFEYIMTSLNLYDSSLANNIEVGIRGDYSFKGLLGKAIINGAEAISNGVDKVKHDVLGTDKVISPIEKFKIIFDNSDLKYKTKPIVVEKGGIQGFIGIKKLDSFEVVINKFDLIPSSTASKPKPLIESKKHEKYLSASQLSKSLGVTKEEIQNLMQKKGLIVGDKITENGLASGLTIKTYMGKDYIAYPENLPEFKQLNNLEY